MATASASSDNAYFALLSVVAQSCLQVALIAVLGYILARKKIINASVRRSLNKLNNNVFTPCLLCSKIAFSLTPSKLAELWVVPIGFVIVTCVSVAAALLLGYLFRLKKSQTAFAVACASCPNANSLPVALMQSLVYSVESQLRWQDDDKKETMLGRALSYLVLFSTLGTIYRWSVAVKIFSISDDPPIKLLDEPEEQHRMQVTSPPAVDEPQDPLISTAQEDASNPAPANPVKRPVPGRSNTGVFSSFPNTPKWQTPANTPNRGPSTASSDSDTDDESETVGGGGATTEGAGYENDSDSYASGDDLLGIPSSQQRRSSGFMGRRRMTKLRRGYRKTKHTCHHKVVKPLSKVAMVVGDFMTVPLWSVLLSIFICFIPPVQHTLDLMVPLKEALKSSGNCSIPITLIVLGSFMHQEEESPSVSSTNKQQHRSHPRPTTSLRKGTSPASQGESRTVFVTILARMFLTPALVMPLLYWMSLARGGVGDDPVFVVSAALIIGSPPALTLAQITDAAAPGFESLISKLMMWSYAVCTAPTTLVLVLGGLWFDQLDQHNH